MDHIILSLISDIVIENNDIISIAIKNRNKFEGWLKFELANKLAKIAFDVTVETQYANRRDRYDLSFFDDKYNFYPIELKTPNTNWDIIGIKKCTKPITNNIKSIIADTKKLNSNFGLVAFVLFPIPTNDNNWTEYFYRIKKECDLDIDVEKNCRRLNIIFDKNQNNCDIIICCFFSKKYNNFF
ncbi:hypothetical protein [Cloacibacterium normanense]|uniref:hypothetical protein n=1 Tax=Cloacibacterium normanense TaxID=237258 RepID=UPI00352EAE6D